MATVVGGGPGSIRCLTAEALEKIRDARDVVSFGRIGELVKQINPEARTVGTVSELLDVVSKDTVVVASGDPGFYGITCYLERNGVEVDEVIPGISSLQYMMAKLKKSYQDVETVSFHGKSMDVSIFEGGKTYFALTDSKNSPDAISKELFRCGRRGRIVLGENLSYEDERLESRKIGDSFGDCGLSVVVIELEVD